MSRTAISRIVEMQVEDGSFLSDVRGPGGTWIDHNGFTTARVLRALRDVPSAPEIDRLRARALDFVERCRSRTIPGAFGFWPADARPDWATGIPADIDDTVIMTMELLRHGRTSRHHVLPTVCNVLLRYRVSRQSAELRPPWISEGAFLTWIGPPGTPNMVDCAVNANVVALMASVNAADLSGYHAAVRTIFAGLEWAGDDRGRLRSLTPFYPSIGDLLEAVEHAVECGASDLRPALMRLRAIPDVSKHNSLDCCSSAYGMTVWRCPALEEAIRIRHIGESSTATGLNNGSSRYDHARSARCRTTDTLTSIGRSNSMVDESTTRTVATPSP